MKKDYTVWKLFTGYVLILMMILASCGTTQYNVGTGQKISKGCGN